MTVNEISEKDIWGLSESDAFELVQTIEQEQPSEKKSEVLKYINSAFEFRTVSKRRKNQQDALRIYGFQFFQRKEQPEKMVGVCKRKTSGSSIF